MTDDIYQRYIFAASRHSGKHMNKLIGWVFNHDTKEFERDDNLALQLIEIAVLLLSFGMIFVVLIISLYNLWSAFQKVELNIISQTLLSDPEVLKDLRTLKHLEEDKNYTDGMGIMETYSWKTKLEPPQPGACEIITGSITAIIIFSVLFGAKLTTLVGAICIGIPLGAVMTYQCTCCKPDYKRINRLAPCGKITKCRIKSCCENGIRCCKNDKTIETDEDRMIQQLAESGDRDPPPLCCFRIFCCTRRVKIRVKAKARDLADASSSWYEMIYYMQDDYTDYPKCDCLRRCLGCCCRNSAKVDPTDTTKTQKDAQKTYVENNKDKETKEDNEEQKLIPLKQKDIDFIGLQYTAKRLLNRVSLMASYTDLMFFVEVLMPEKPGPASHTSAAIYSEMDHSSLFLEVIVMFLQLLVVALIVAPLVFFSIAWAYFETYYFGDLQGFLPKNDTYNNLAFDMDLYPLHCIVENICPLNICGRSDLFLKSCSDPVYIRIAPFIYMNFLLAFLYILLEYFNAVNLYLLHGTKAETYGEYHRLLEFRKIANDQAQRERRFNDTRSWRLMEDIPDEYIYKPRWTKICCHGTSKYNFLALVYHWMDALCCSNQGSCFHKCWENCSCFNCCCCCTRKKRFKIGDEVDVKLSGWTNKFIGKVIQVNRINVDDIGGRCRRGCYKWLYKVDEKVIKYSYNICFITDENKNNLKQLRSLNNKKQKDTTTSEIIECEAFVGDMIIMKDKEGVYRVTHTRGTGARRSYSARIIQDGEGQETNDIKPDDIQYVYHSYPTVLWWDLKENEPMYLKFQLGFRNVLNVFRSLFFVCSMFLLLGTALWCVLGVFIFPEKFAPYSTAIFTTALNAKVLYSKSIGKLKELEERLVEGVKDKRLASSIAQMRQTMLGKVQSKVNSTDSDAHSAFASLRADQEIYQRVTAFLKNPSQEALLNNPFDFNNPWFNKHTVLRLKLQNYQKLCNANLNTDRDSIIPESIRDKILREHGLTKRSAILLVLLSSFVIVAVFAFLILGMTLFADGDAFSAAISSLLGATAGLVNIVQASGKNESQMKRLAARLVAAWSQAIQNDTGVSLNDNLGDAVVRRAKQLQEEDLAQRAEQSNIFSDFENAAKQMQDGVVNKAKEFQAGVKKSFDEQKNQLQNEWDETKNSFNKTKEDLENRIADHKKQLTDAVDGTKKQLEEGLVKLQEEVNLVKTSLEEGPIKLQKDLKSIKKELDER